MGCKKAFRGLNCRPLSAMLYLLFELGENRYAMEATRVVEVLPFLQPQKMPHSPAGMAGYFSYRGELVPVIDLCQLVTGTAARHCLSTPIILVHFTDQEGKKRLAGLLAEQATTTIQKQRSEFMQSGISTRDANYLGPVAIDQSGFIQLIDADKLLIERARDLLSYLPEGGQ